MGVLSASVRRYRAAILAIAGVAGGFAGGRLTAAGDPMVTVRREDARFVPVDPSRPTLAEMAVLWGDPATGPSAMLMKMKKAAGVLHLHTSTYDLVLLEGRMKHWGEREREADAPPLGPGSYWHQPGLQAHGDSCLTEECVMFIKWEGKRDGMLAPPPPK